MPDDPNAATLIREAAQLAQRQHKLDDARKKLDDAAALNPRQAYLWSAYGYLAFISGKSAEGVEDLQRELSAHPDEDDVAMQLAQAQMKLQMPQDAIVTLQKLLAVRPANEQAASTLAIALMSTRQFSDAEKILRSLLAAHPDDLTQLRLCTALLREDKKTEAASMLRSMAISSQNPAFLNDAAFALADENLDVPLAVQAAKHALALLEAPGPTATAYLQPLARTEMFVSIWDTLGWALFRSGKAAEAEPLLRAAWANSLGAETGYHLGMVLEKQGQPAKALAIYQVAAFGEPGDNDAVVATNNAERQAALRQAGTPTQIMDGKAGFEALRTFRVPGPNRLRGAAIVEIDISAAGKSNAIIVKEGENDDSLTPVESSLYRIDFRASVPPGSHAILTRRGQLTCHAGTPCQFVLLSTRAALAN